MADAGPPDPASYGSGWDAAAPYLRAMDLDLSALTTAELQTMRTNLLAAHGRALNAEVYNVGARGLSRPSAKSVLEQLEAVSRELARRGDVTGGLISVQFTEA